MNPSFLTDFIPIIIYRHCFVNLPGMSPHLKKESLRYQPEAVFLQYIKSGGAPHGLTTTAGLPDSYCPPVYTGLLVSQGNVVGAAFHDGDGSGSSHLRHFQRRLGGKDPSANGNH